MVWIRSPPGVSIAWANRRRAWARSTERSAVSAPSARISASSAASSFIAHSPRRRNSLSCISDAAALV